MNSMPCPNCHNDVEVGSYMKHKHGVCPNDVRCKCGAWLRYCVPLYKTTPSGWIWQIVLEPREISNEHC